MFDEKVSDKIKRHSWEYVNTFNMGCRSSGFNGSKEKQYLGMIGENMVRWNYGLDLKREGGFDGGSDLWIGDYRFDVKTMGRNCDPKPDYVNNVFKEQIKYEIDGYVFCSFNKRNSNLTVCGWVDKPTFLNKAVLYQDGDKRERSNGTEFTVENGIYEIKNKYLYKSIHWKDLFDQIEYQ